MIPSSDEFLRRRMEPVLLALRAGSFPQHASHPSQAAPLRFVTISRQTGANGWPLAERLVERLNASGQSDPPWTCWDRELVEKVAADHHISKQLIESLEDSGRSWLGELCSAISIADGSDDTFRAYRRVAMTIHRWKLRIRQSSCPPRTHLRLNISPERTSTRLL